MGINPSLSDKVLVYKVLPLAEEGIQEEIV